MFNFKYSIEYDVDNNPLLTYDNDKMNPEVNYMIYATSLLLVDGMLKKGKKRNKMSQDMKDQLIITVGTLAEITKLSGDILKNQKNIQDQVNGILNPPNNNDLNETN